MAMGLLALAQIGPAFGETAADPPTTQDRDSVARRSHDVSGPRRIAAH